ncbi:MAG: anti-anti-sigma factor [Candidatus Accumulibacter adjunctus]|uniref:Anti-anti-sigma factor n=1 Tax=Candidatus Accumulibacter adjunctus TaxID=1454001 RepID=A0A011NRK0_9PROT|nr:MAG: anti-anti-sigma factor [Candidatus Accumulibacter adjunctus]
MRASPTKRLVIDEDMTIYRAQEQKEQLLAALAAADQLELDLAGVGEIDTAGLQLLILLKREGLRQDKRLTISGHSPAVQHVLDFCNLVGVFGDPLVIPASA